MSARTPGVLPIMILTLSRTSYPLTTALIFLLLGAPLGKAVAQSPMPRVGYLSLGSSSDQARQRRYEAFRQGLRELGYVEGRNIALEARWAEGYDRLPALAAELIRLKVDVIVTLGGRATQVVQQATKTIPIVMSLVIHPLGIGLVSSGASRRGHHRHVDDGP
jgi:putative ABC transport system substrate-binding protein